MWNATFNRKFEATLESQCQSFQAFEEHGKIRQREHLFLKTGLKEAFFNSAENFQLMHLFG